MKNAQMFLHLIVPASTFRPYKHTRIKTIPHFYQNNDKGVQPVLVIQPTFLEDRVFCSNSDTERKCRFTVCFLLLCMTPRSQSAYKRRNVLDAVLEKNSSILRWLSGIFKNKRREIICHIAVFASLATSSAMRHPPDQSTAQTSFGVCRH